MKNRYWQTKIQFIGLTVIAAAVQSAMAAPPVSFNWSTVVNNGAYIPTNTCDPAAANPTTPPCKKFNSYNQPSVNGKGLVVFRARSKGGEGGGGGEGETAAGIADDGGSEVGNQPVHGVYTRDMSILGAPIVKILDRNTLAPQPNNLDSVFIEPPSFPRIDIGSNTIATRGNHQPVWRYTLPDGSETRVGTTGIYTNPFGDLITGASKLGSVPEFSFFEVPEVPFLPFDVFPGSPAVTNGNTIVFKGNYTVDSVGKTGVYYRDLRNVDINGGPGGGSNPVVLIANNTDTLIPGTDTVFGSTAPPSAANGRMVFAGFDNEDNPAKGGIYLAPLNGPTPPLVTLVGIGSPVPGETNASFNKLGEGVSFDGRLVSFWGAWGTETREVVLQCPAEGNKARVKFCNAQYPNGFKTKVPVNQGIFVYDTANRKAYRIAKTGADFTDFLYWNFSGRVPGQSEGSEGDDGEAARWRSSAFMAVSGHGGANYHDAFKARTGLVDGIYLVRGPGQPQMKTVIKTGMDGGLFDPEAAGLPVTEMGIERDGFRGDSLVINASMGNEETGWAGIYLTRVPKP
ncbi:MAG: hypothetical protein PHY54_08940 [Methylococcales bacterium]|nr:hypothetical protein [Methylococcales bacterium]